MITSWFWAEVSNFLKENNFDFFTSNFCSKSIGIQSIGHKNQLKMALLSYFDSYFMKRIFFRTMLVGSADEKSRQVCGNNLQIQHHFQNDIPALYESQGNSLEKLRQFFAF